MWTCGDVPAVGMDKGGRGKGVAPVAGKAQHHITNLPREDFAPGDGHRFLRCCGHMNAATDTGVPIELDDLLDAAAALTHARQICSALFPPLAAIEPRDDHGPVGGHGYAFKRM
jgi:hypothetical protein